MGTSRADSLSLDFTFAGHIIIYNSLKVNLIAIFMRGGCMFVQLMFAHQNLHLGRSE